MDTLTLTEHESLAGARAPAPVRQGVPWATVATLAVVLAFADGIWLTSLRGAVGSIELSQSPFRSWLLQSAAVLPVFAIAVLAALTLAARRFGPVLRSPRELALTAAAVVVAGTVVTLLWAVAGSAYDFHLQVRHLRAMNAMHTLCTRDCLDKQVQATLSVHVHALLYVGRWLVLTNVVLVAWVVATMGGRLSVTTVRHGAPDRKGALRLLVIGGLAGAAVVHAAVAPHHLHEWPAAGMFFVLLALWELGVASMLLVRLTERAVLLAAAAVSAGPLALWLWSRTAGMPFGPAAGIAEPVGVPDLMACLLEVGSLLAAVVLLRGTSRRPSDGHVRGMAVLALVAVTTIGVATVGLTGFDAFGVGNVASQAHLHHH
jgi:hypothetical protein